jgi:hypothetical protein
MRSSGALSSVLALILVLSACNSSQETADPEGKSKEEKSERREKQRRKGIVQVEKREWERRSSDPFEFRGVKLQNEEFLRIAVRYSGGCEEHGFRILAAPGREKSDPPQRHIFLEHDANGDACRSVIRDTLSFGLRKLDPPLILHLEGYDEPIRYGLE